LWIALDGLWKKSRTCLGGNDLILPLVGSGLSGTGLPAKDLLNLILLSVVSETKRKPITARICVVLREDLSDEIDLKEIKRYWS
jgi:hypothetical protein